MLNRCPLPMELNPICTCNTMDSCLRFYTILNYKNETYILYRCKGCQHALNLDTETIIEKIIKPLNNKDILYGKEFDKLISIANESNNSSQDYVYILSFFEHIFSKLGPIGD
jgi:hypothetical protein